MRGALALACAALPAAQGAGSATLGASYVERSAGSLWAAFKRSHGKQYRDSAEESRRLAHFKENMQRASELGRRNPHAHFGPTPFSDLSPAEFRARSGLRPREPTLAAVAQGPPPLSASRLAASERTEIDWRAAGAVTNVKNQGECGGCWAFAAVGSIEGAWARAPHPLTSLSEQHLISCCHEFRCNGCDGGNPEGAFMYLMQNTQGRIATEAAYPYTEVHCSVDRGCQADACKYSPSMATGAQIKSHVAIPNDDAAEQAMLVALQDKGPVAVGVSSEAWQHYSGGILTDCGTEPTVDHGVTLVGYGHEKGSGMQYWTIKNSWGTSWGENGYIRVQYNKNLCSIRTMAAYAVVASAGPMPVPAVLSAPMEQEYAPALVPAHLPDPYLAPHDSPPPTPAPNHNNSVCVSGDDCDCPDMGMGLSGKKVGPQLCASTAIVAGAAALLFLLLGIAFARCCCAPQKRRPVQPLYGHVRGAV
eukprot:TRINITY_DN10934_c0_g1_i1.p1 TRINITY_DN10934_c0_g1~~TRINITY_DN10934_c0_g1_i1.p1  ORF type:complete len:476 (+),score=111.93 TRINITY_DN10934_c0_g1_i1:67-1494(+)